MSIFLLSFFLPVFLGFNMVFFIYWVKLNWLMPGYITGIILLGRFFSHKFIKAQIIFSLIIHLALAIEILFYPIEIKSDDTWWGWKELSVQVQKVQNRYPDTFIFSADDYKTSAILNFYSDTFIYSRNVIGENALQFNYIPLLIGDLKGRDALFINSSSQFKKETKENQYPPALNTYFESVEELDPILIKTMAAR